LPGLFVGWQRIDHLPGDETGDSGHCWVELGLWKQEVAGLLGGDKPGGFCLLHGVDSLLWIVAHAEPFM